MSYYDRLAKEYGEMGNSKVSENLDTARNVASEAQNTSSQLITTLRNKEMGKFGTILGEKVGGKFVMDKLMSGAKRFITDPKRLDLTNQAKTLRAQGASKGQQAEDIYSQGRDRMSQGFNADGSLTADRGMSVRGELDQSIKFREGDILPETAVRDSDGAMAGIDKVSALNKSRFEALDADSQRAVKQTVNANPNYRKTSDIAQDKSAGNITREEAENQRLNSKMIEQDAIGDQEETASTVLRGANPFTGTRTGGTTGREVTGQMGDSVDEALDRTTGLSRTEQSTADTLTGEEVTAEAGAEALGGATIAETALSAIPVIGEIVGLGLGLGEGIKDGIKTAKETAQQTLDMKADDQNINNTVKYAGYNRPNFGSMALPSFDTSHSSALLQE
tara:strand:- start:7541 stop:8713 length:1173 start_codon:yes stop_codon:yes gene_type:complete